MNIDKNINTGPLYKILTEYKNRDALRAHMPSHAGNPAAFLYPELTGIGTLDVTELLDTDDLFINHSDSASSMDEAYASDLFGSDYCLFSTCGATLCIQTAVMMAKRYGGVMLLDRFSHKSVFNAAALCNIDYKFLYRNDTDKSEQLYCVITKNDIASALSDEITSIFITSPNYYGICADYNEICSFIKEENSRRESFGLKKLILIVDNSHGSHLRFAGNGSLYPIADNYKADIVIDSVHKTFGSLGSSAVLHITGSAADFFSKNGAKNIMKIFSTTSPSFILMLGIENALYNPLNTLGYNEFYSSVSNFQNSLGTLKYIHSQNTVEKADKSRLTLCCDYFTGDELYDLLHEKNIICEMSDDIFCVLILSPYNSSQSTLNDLKSALKHIDSLCDSLSKKQRELISYKDKNFIYPEIENMKYTLSEAITMNTRGSTLQNALGAVCGEYIYLYPPGIPIAIPGQIISPQIIKICSEMGLEHIKTLD